MNKPGASSSGNIRLSAL